MMDYIGPVVAEDEKDQGKYFMDGVGIYDAFCIKYGYAVVSDEDKSHRGRGGRESDARAVGRRGRGGVERSQGSTL